MAQDDESYSAESIQVLEGLQAVRKRPSMYIGSTDSRGLHHLVYEVVDNSIDEALSGYCKNIEVTIKSNGAIRVEDDGRGIPVGTHPKYQKPALEIVMTVLHSGGKFDKRTYKVSGGLHGVGVHVVNALSEYLIAEVKRNGELYRQRFEYGNPVTDVEVVGSAEGTGTIITFKPDSTIFETTKFDYNIIANRMKELAFLNKGLRIVVRDERTGKEEEFQYDGGIVSFVSHINENRNVIHEDIIHIHDVKEDVEVDIALQYTADYAERIYAFANNINTVDGGTHLIGFKSSLTRILNDFGRKNNKLKKNVSLSGDDTREGLTAVLHVKVPNPQFEGQTKTRLGNSEVRGIVESITSENLIIYFEENPKTLEKILNRCLMAYEARDAARRARELTRRKTIFESSTLPGKLADCTEKDPQKAELFIVEGDSAGGSAKQGRDRKFQAILPLRGKIINVEKAPLHKILKNQEIEALITAIGTGIKEDFNINKLRYHKIIIMTDADVDGAHIRTLLLTFFYRYMRALIEYGHIYIAQPPLYRITKGREVYYAYSEHEKDEIVKNLGEKVAIQRYKGLGEMNPQQLWETTMNPEARVLKEVSIENAVRADEIFSTLMGDDVEPRREFIQEHAKEVANLDV